MLRSDDSRYLHRGDLNWKEVELRKNPETRAGKIYKGIMQLLSIRKTLGVFDGHADTWALETYNDHVLGIGRYYNGEKLIALFNFSENEQTAWINEAEEYKDLLTGETKEARAIALPGYSFVWLLTSFNREEKTIVSKRSKK